MSKKHNKKRNTGFLYESLVVEMTNAMISKDLDKRDTIKRALQEHFKTGTELHKELSLYKSVLDAKEIESDEADFIIEENCRAHSALNKEKLFEQKTSLINFINKNLDRSFYGNFVPSYKSLASVSTMFSDKAAAQEKYKVKKVLIEGMTAKSQEDPNKMKHIDELSFNLFVKKFNQKYSENLLEEQKELLSKYILSFIDNGLEFKIHLNEELANLKSSLVERSKSSLDEKVSKMMSDVVDILESYKKKEIDEKALMTILEVQEMLSEKQNAN
jgi:hypothetical protein